LNFFFFFGSFDTIWTWFIAVQPILAAIFMALWLKEKRLHPLAWMLGGVGWAFSSFNLVWLEWGNVGHAGLWLPLALLAVDKISYQESESKNKRWWHLIFQLALICSLFAGHWQVTLYLVIAVSLYWLMTFGLTKKHTWLLITHYFLFLLFTSSQWVSTLRFTLKSNRVVEQQDVLTREGFFIKPKQLVQLIAPDYLGNPATQNYRGEWNYAEQVIYVGIIPLVLALVSLSNQITGANNNPKKIVSRFSTWLVLTGLLLATDNLVARLPYRIQVPFWSDLQPTRLSYLTTFGLSVLAALGMDSFILSPKRLSKRMLLISVVFGVALVGLMIVSSQLVPAERLVSRRNLILPAVLVLVSLVGVGVGWISERYVKLGSRKRGHFLFLLSTFYFLLSTLDLFRFGWKFTPFSPREYLYPSTPTLKYLQEHMEPDDRYMTLDRRILPPNASIIYRLKTIEGYDPIYSQDYALQVTQMESGEEADQPASFGRIIRPTNFRSEVADQLGVRYVLSLSDVADPQLIKVFQEGETRIYQLTNN
jgi:hypothetical protein